MKAQITPCAPDPLNANPLRDFLKDTGVDSGRVEEMVADVKLTVARYAGHGTTSNLMSLKEHLKEVHAAAERLAEALQPRHYSDDLWPAIKEAYCTRPAGVQTDADAKNARRLDGQWRDRIGHQSNFLANVALIRDESKEALDRLKKPGPPRAEKVWLVEQLIVIWRLGTGKNPGSSGRATWKTPDTPFAKFVKLCVQILPSTGEFEKGFKDRLNRAIAKTNNVAKPAPKN